MDPVLFNIADAINRDLRKLFKDSFPDNYMRGIDLIEDKYRNIVGSEVNLRKIISDEAEKILKKI